MNKKATVIIGILILLLMIAQVDAMQIAAIALEENNSSPQDNITDPSNPDQEVGFEAVFAIAGLFAVAFLVLRQRK